MLDQNKPVILCVDDDQDILDLMKMYLQKDYYVITAKSGQQALNQVFTKRKPDLIFLDVMMSGQDGFSVCQQIQDSSSAHIPVVFVSSLDKDATLAKAYLSGAVDYLGKPFSKQKLLNCIAKHVETPLFWHRTSSQPATKRAESRKIDFQKFLGSYLNLTKSQKQGLETCQIAEIYLKAAEHDICEADIAMSLAEFCSLDYLPIIDPAWNIEQSPGQSICLNHPVHHKIQVVSNPITQDLSADIPIMVATPSCIENLCVPDPEIKLLDQILIYCSHTQGQLHIVEKGNSFQLNIDEEIITELCSNTMEKVMQVVINKADITADKTQGKLKLSKNGRTIEFIASIDFNTRSLTIQSPSTRVEVHQTIANYIKKRQHILQPRGIILVIGPKGAEKSTTASAILSESNIRPAITVEESIKCKVDGVIQHQVNDSAGATYEALLKSAIGQNPQVIYLDRIHNYFSARVLMEYARKSLAITTLPVETPQEALNLLESFGLRTVEIIDNISVIINQRLLPKLCPYCKTIEPIPYNITNKISSNLPPLPTRSAKPKGCLKCNKGYSGLEPLMDIQVISNYSRKDLLTHGFIKFPDSLGHQALESVSNFSISLDDALGFLLEASHYNSHLQTHSKTILLVDDDDEHNELMRSYLSPLGYSIICANNGVDALLSLSNNPVDLVFVDIDMPTMDGFRFAQLGKTSGSTAPLIFVSSNNNQASVLKALQLGAVDFIAKPINKQMLIKKTATHIQKTAFK